MSKERLFASLLLFFLTYLDLNFDSFITFIFLFYFLLYKNDSCFIFLTVFLGLLKDSLLGSSYWLIIYSLQAATLVFLKPFMLQKQFFMLWLLFLLWLLMIVLEIYVFIGFPSNFYTSLLHFCLTWLLFPVCITLLRKIF